MKYKISTPLNPSFSGQRHGIQFYMGEAKAENLTKSVLNEFNDWGYVVEEIAEKPAPAKKTTKKATK